jgi:hypothetical protein
MTPGTYYRTSLETDHTFTVRLRFPFKITDWAMGYSAVTEGSKLQRYEQMYAERKRIEDLIHDQMEVVGADGYRVMSAIAEAAGRPLTETVREYIARMALEAATASPIPSEPGTTDHLAAPGGHIGPKPGTLSNNDAYHWQVRKDGKVLVDWWPHKCKFRVGGKLHYPAHEADLVATLKSLPPEEQKPGDDSEIRRLLDEAELKQAFFQDAADKACRGEPEALASLQRLAESALSAARNVRKQKPGDVKGGCLMPKVYFVRDETGFDFQFVPTLKEAQAEFQSLIADGSEPEGVHSISYVPTRRGICALLNSLRQTED